MVDVDLCGHATLAAGRVLLQYHYPLLQQVSFSTASGVLAVNRVGDSLSLDFPAPGAPLAVSQALVAALGARPHEAFLARDILAVFDTEAEVRALRPDYDRVAALDAFAVIVTAPGSDVDFVSRFFAPGAGIPEDPSPARRTARSCRTGRRASGDPRSRPGNCPPVSGP